MAKMTDPESSQVKDDILSTMHGGLRVLGGMVEVAAGVTRLLADSAIKAVQAVEGFVGAREVDEKDPEPKHR